MIKMYMILVDMFLSTVYTSPFEKGCLSLVGLNVLYFFECSTTEFYK